MGYLSSKVKSCELVFEFVILIYPAAKFSLIQMMALKIKLPWETRYYFFTAAILFSRHVRNKITLCTSPIYFFHITVNLSDRETEKRTHWNFAYLRYNHVYESSGSILQQMVIGLFEFPHLSLRLLLRKGF